MRYKSIKKPRVFEVAGRINSTYISGRQGLPVLLFNEEVYELERPAVDVSAVGEPEVRKAGQRYHTETCYTFK